MGRELYLHLKTNRVYEIISSTAKWEGDWSDAVVYRLYGEENSTVVVRAADEFFDGRFQRIGEAEDPKAFTPMKDVADFHEEFDLPHLHPMGALSQDMMELRATLMREELMEWFHHQSLALDELSRAPRYREQANYTHHLEECLDGLVDLAYATLVTAHAQGFGGVFEEAWSRVHKANMSKVRADLDNTGKRNSLFDVVKPAGWEKPDHSDLVEDNDLRTRTPSP